jgi:hypothetical protein
MLQNLTKQFDNNFNLHIAEKNMKRKQTEFNKKTLFIAKMTLALNLLVEVLGLKSLGVEICPKFPLLINSFLQFHSTPLFVNYVVPSPFAY